MCSFLILYIPTDFISVLSHLENIKYVAYSWNFYLLVFISDIRSREERMLVKSGYFTSWSITLSPITPNIATVITIIVHVALGNELSASEVSNVVTKITVLHSGTDSNFTKIKTKK